MMEDLGAGFYLAMHDLEIRGAGEVLGESQSGEMQEVGFQLYADMLQGGGVGAEGRARARPRRAARRHHRDQPARAGAAARDATAATCTSGSSSTSGSRTARPRTSSRRMQEELVDRFGRPPEPAQALIACHRLRLVAKPMGVVKIDAGPGAQHAAVRQGPAVRRRRADPARAEGRPHPLRRSRPRPHRARGADARRARRAGEGIPVATAGVTDAELPGRPACRRSCTCSSATGCRRTTSC